MPLPRSRSSTVTRRRSSARPMRRHARSKPSSTSRRSLRPSDPFTRGPAASRGRRNGGRRRARRRSRGRAGGAVGAAAVVVGSPRGVELHKQPLQDLRLELRIGRAGLHLSGLRDVVYTSIMPGELRRRCSEVFYARLRSPRAPVTCPSRRSNRPSRARGPRVRRMTSCGSFGAVSRPTPVSGYCRVAASDFFSTFRPTYAGQKSTSTGAPRESGGRLTARPSAGCPAASILARRRPGQPPRQWRRAPPGCPGPGGGPCRLLLSATR